MDDTHLPKTLLYGELANAPHWQGRAYLHFKDVVKRDLKTLDINPQRWETIPSDRLNWRTAINNGSQVS